MATLIDCQPTGDEQTAIDRPLAVRYTAGTVLSGKYQLETLLGEGGMGAVWRATNVLLDLPVAIKLIRADLDPGALRARLQLEARSAAKLGHSSIVRVYDVGESELGDPFIVMEHLRGETLAQLIRRGRVPAIRAVQLLLPIIDALAVAHGRGIVHRDLKPDNLMLALEEQRICPKILDFGIAKLLDPRDSDHKLTEIGAVVGSPEYMSPEQARGRDDVDASTDIWSICVVLYEAITGCAPFTASNCNALLRSIVEDAPRPFSEHALDNGELWQLVERGLNKDRAQRYAKISELGQALAGWLVRQGVAEDACGGSLDSKWLGRGSNRLSLVQAAPVSTGSEQSSSRPMQDSNPDSTGTARGPFTKTVLPASSGHTRTLGVVGVASALLAVSLLALGHSPPPRASARAESAPAVTITLPVAVLAPKPVLAAPIEPTVEPAIAQTASAPESTKPLVTAPVSESAPKSVAARVNRPISGAIRAIPPVANPVASSAAPAAPKPERALDLLVPY